MNVLGYISFTANFVPSPSFCCLSLCSDKHGRERFLYQGECWESCPAGHYPAEGHTCLPCSENCELCRSAHICTRCVVGYLIAPANHTCQKLECGQGKAALGRCLIPGGSKRSSTLDGSEMWTDLPALMLAPGMIVCDCMSSGNSDGCSPLLLHTPLSGSLQTFQRHRNAANHREIDIESRVCGRGRMERKSD